MQNHAVTSFMLSSSLSLCLSPLTSSDAFTTQHQSQHMTLRSHSLNHIENPLQQTTPLTIPAQDCPCS
jgi:hypothetical protein